MGQIQLPAKGATDTAHATLGRVRIGAKLASAVRGTQQQIVLPAKLILTAQRRQTQLRHTRAVALLTFKMPKFEAKTHLTLEQYSRVVEGLQMLCTMLLFEFARHEGDVREQILRNFVARAATAARGVLQLWEMKDYHDCWVLHRSLLDRLFHLHALNERDEFDAFEAWSFKLQYEAVNRLKSDLDAVDVIGTTVVDPTPKQRDRYRSLVNMPPSWRRPDPDKIARAMDLGFLYKYGYDFASSHVHPMADDGQEDFYNMTGLQPRPNFPDWRTVLSNTVLVATMIVQEALNASRLSWRKIVFDVIEGIRNYLVSGSPAEHVPLVNLAKMVEKGVHLSRPGNMM